MAGRPAIPRYSSAPSELRLGDLPRWLVRAHATFKRARLRRAPPRIGVGPAGPFDLHFRSARTGERGGESLDRGERSLRRGALRAPLYAPDVSRPSAGPRWPSAVVQTRAPPLSNLHCGGFLPRATPPVFVTVRVARALHAYGLPVWSEAAPPAPLRGHFLKSARRPGAGIDRQGNALHAP